MGRIVIVSILVLIACIAITVAALLMLPEYGSSKRSGTGSARNSVLLAQFGWPIIRKMLQAEETPTFKYPLALIARIRRLSTLRFRSLKIIDVNELRRDEVIPPHAKLRTAA
jgi:hypothetical protein